MSATELDTPLLLESKQRTADGGGGWTISWAPLGTLWARVRAGRANEREHGARVYGRVTHRISVRHAAVGSPRRPGADQRFRLGDRIFNVLGVSEARAPGFLECWCEEGPLS